MTIDYTYRYVGMFACYDSMMLQKRLESAAHQSHQPPRIVNNICKELCANKWQHYITHASYRESIFIVTVKWALASSSASNVLINCINFSHWKNSSNWLLWMTWLDWTRNSSVRLYCFSVLWVFIASQGRLTGYIGFGGCESRYKCRSLYLINQSVRSRYCLTNRSSNLITIG